MVNSPFRLRQISIGSLWIDYGHAVADPFNPDTSQRDSSAIGRLCQHQVVPLSPIACIGSHGGFSPWAALPRRPSPPYLALQRPVAPHIAMHCPATTIMVIIASVVLQCMAMLATTRVAPTINVGVVRNACIALPRPAPSMQYAWNVKHSNLTKPHALSDT